MRRSILFKGEKKNVTRIIHNQFKYTLVVTCGTNAQKPFIYFHTFKINTGINMVASAKAAGLPGRTLPTTVTPFGLCALMAGTIVTVIPAGGLSDTFLLMRSTVIFTTVYLLANWILRTDGPSLALATLRSVVRRNDR